MKFKTPVYTPKGILQKLSLAFVMRVNFQGLTFRKLSVINHE